MRNNYFAKLINYTKKVYHIERGLNKLKDKRVNPTYKTELIVTIVLFGFLLRIESFNELNLMIKNGELTFDIKYLKGGDLNVKIFKKQSKFFVK